MLVSGFKYRNARASECHLGCNGRAKRIIIHVTRLRSVGRVADHRHFPLSEHGPLPGVRRLSVSAGLASANKMRSPAFVSCLEFARLPPAFRRRVVFLLRNAVSTRA